MLPRSKPLQHGLAALLTLAAAQAARADVPATTATVTISGSTAFKGFFQAPGSTNDWIDMNNDGIFGFNNAGGTGPADAPFVQQIAPNVSIVNGSVSSYLVSPNLNGAGNAAYLSVQYRGVGSVNGLVELVNYSLNGSIPSPTTLGDPSYLNRTQVSAGGTTTFSGPGGFPIATPLTSVDAAVLDVSIPWGVQGAAGTAAWNKKPTAAGYGLNQLLPANATHGQSNLLASLTSGAQSLNLNTATPNSKTVFGTAMAFAPISVVSNHGTGLQNVTQTQLAFLYVTGRMADGTNLVAATRDIGSGTRNGAMNSIGVDPSFGIGENIGDITTNATRQSALGADFQPTNLDATGTMESVVRNSRLAVGYVSTTNGKSDQATGIFETLGVQFDLEGGTAFVRPTAATLINNSNTGSGGTGYRIGGIETFATVGDPLATSVNASYPALTANPQMANPAAAAYIRNIYESIKTYTSNPSAVTNTFSPAQTLLTSNFLPIGALAQVQTNADGTVWTNNTAFSAAVSADAATIAGLNTGAYGSGTSAFGVVPTRQNLTAGTYTDGQTINYRYFDNTGTQFTVSANTALNLRNAIAGDFNNDAQRNINDVPQLVAAALNPNAWAQANHSGQAGAGLGTAAIPEILGDFNGDGNFNKADVRYFADGLATATTGPHAGKLDRKAGFTAVDTNASGNFFATTFGGTIAKAYAFGDSRGDIAGSITGPTPGAGPTGSDGIINAKDIDYTWHQVRGALGAGNDGSFATLLTRATTDPTVNVRADLSADMNGDLILNKSDVDELVQTILGTQYGDATLDGKVTGADYTLLANNFGGAGGWATGDFNGDGVITGADYTLLADNFGFATAGGAGPAFAPSAPVPEPASLALLGLGALGTLRRRRRTAK